MRRFCVGLLVAGVALYGQAPVPATPRSTERDVALGKTIASQVRARTTAVQLPAVDNYLLNLCRQLAGQVPNAPAAWQLTMVAESGGLTHEPLALPGGYVFVPAALVLSVESESELAGMLAHAVVHAAAGDSLIRANGFATIPVTFIVSNFGSDGMGEPVMPMKFSHLQQGRELTADTAAIRIMAAAGFDPNALLRYVERTQPGSESGWEKLSSALPLRDARLANLNTSLEGLRGGAAPPSSSSFAAAQNSLRLATARIARPQKTPSLGQSY